MRFALVCYYCFEIEWKYMESLPWHTEQGYRRWWTCLNCAPEGTFEGENSEH